MKSKDNTPVTQFEDKLNSFLKGEMTPAEEQAFKILLQERPELKQKAVAIARLAKALRQVGEERDQAVIEELGAVSRQKIEGLTDNICNNEPNGNIASHPFAASIIAKPKYLSFRRFVVSFSAAASILLCIFGGYKYYKYEQVSSLGQEYLAYFPASEFSRGEGDNVSERIQALYGNIADKKDLDATIEELLHIWDASRSEEYNDYTEYMPELGWMLANAYLRGNDKKKAIEVLDKLIEDHPKDTAIGEKARELKQKVEDL